MLKVLVFLLVFLSALPAIRPYVLILSVKGSACFSTLTERGLVICGWIEFEDRWRGFVALVNEDLEWLVVVREAYELRKAVVVRDTLVVCGSWFIGGFDLESGEFKWGYSSEEWLNDLEVLSDDKVLVCGVGFVAVISSNGDILVEKRIEVNRRGEFIKPFLFASCILKDHVVLAGAAFNMFSKNSRLDCIVVSLSLKDFTPLWCICFGDVYQDRLYGAECDGDSVYVTGHSVSRSRMVQEAVVACINYTGGLKWCKTISARGWSFGTSLTVSGNSLCVVGFTEIAKKSRVLAVFLNKVDGSLREAYSMRLGDSTKVPLGAHVEKYLEGVFISGSSSSHPLVVYWPYFFVGNVSLSNNSTLFTENSSVIVHDWSARVKKIEARVLEDKELHRKNFTVEKLKVSIVSGGKIPKLSPVREPYGVLDLMIIVIACMVVLLFIVKDIRKHVLKRGAQRTQV